MYITKGLFKYFVVQCDFVREMDVFESAVYPEKLQVEGIVSSGWRLRS